MRIRWEKKSPPSDWAHIPARVLADIKELEKAWYAGTLEIDDLKSKYFDLTRELRSKNSELAKANLENETLKTVFLNLEAELQASDLARRMVEEENKSLKEAVEKLTAQKNKNSQNSHKPPSTDPNKKQRYPKNTNGKKDPKKKSGGQIGHKGKTLSPVANPDARFRHPVNRCEGCNHDLSKVLPDKIIERQICDIPPPKLYWEAHEAEVKSCTACGCKTQAAFPGLLGAEPTSKVIYGPNVRAISTYLNQQHFIPLDRTSQFFRDLYDQEISTGSIGNWVNKGANNLQSHEENTKEHFKNSSGPVHFDETGINSNGKNAWLHVTSDDLFTHLAFHNKRGKVAINEIGILPKFMGIAVHDRWSSYLDFPCRHSLCGAHLLRDLQGIVENHKEKWAEEMKTLLTTLCSDVHEAKAKGLIQFDEKTLEDYATQYDKLIKKGLNYHEKQNETRPGKNLVDALEKHKVSILRFIYDFNVPFTNNLAERDFRMTKVKIKVSGCFRRESGARAFCRVRGYISAARKHDVNILKALRLLMEGAPYDFFANAPPPDLSVSKIICTAATDSNSVNAAPLH
jgi:transposase